MDSSQPGSAGCVIAQADYYFYQKKWPEAVNLYVKARKVLGDKSPLFQRITLESLSRCYMNLHDYKAALIWANNLLDISQSTEHRIIAHDLISKICHKLNRLTEEADHLRYCLWRQPLNGIHWYHLGQCYAATVPIDGSDSSSLHDLTGRSCTSLQTSVNRGNNDGCITSDCNHMQGDCSSDFLHHSMGSSDQCHTKSEDAGNGMTRSGCVMVSTRTKGGTHGASTNLKHETCLVELKPKTSLMENGRPEMKMDRCTNGVCKEPETRNDRVIDGFHIGVSDSGLPHSIDGGEGITITGSHKQSTNGSLEHQVVDGRKMVNSNLAVHRKGQTQCRDSEKGDFLEMRSSFAPGSYQTRSLGKKDKGMCGTRQSCEEMDCASEDCATENMSNGMGGGCKMSKCIVWGNNDINGRLDDDPEKTIHCKYALICYIRARILLKPISSLCNTYHQVVLQEVDEHLHLLGFQEQFIARVSQLCWKRQFGNDTKQSNSEEKVATTNEEDTQRTFEKYWFDGIVDQTKS